jgi:hypothetical protein
MDRRRIPHGDRLARKRRHLMRRLLAVLALAAAVGVGAEASVVSAQMPYDPYGSSGYSGVNLGGYPGYNGAYPGSMGAYPGYAGSYAAYPGASPYGMSTMGYPGYSSVGPLAIPGPYPQGPYTSGGYSGVPGYGGVPYGSFTSYAGPILSGSYNATGFPTFGLFPWYAQGGGVSNPTAYSSFSPYALFLGCSSTYSGSNYYVCR